jgi:hypothetical protein
LGVCEQQITKNNTKHLGVLFAWKLAILGFLSAIGLLDASATERTRLWPRQEMPAGLVTISSLGFTQHPDDRRPINDGDDHMLAQSLSGLAAQAVNERRGDELLFIDLWNNNSYHQWRRLLLNRTGIEDRGHASIWQIATRYYQNKVIKGYILYRLPSAIDDEQDCSVNVATSLSGVLRGVMVSERQEAIAKQLGLPLLFDARGKTEAWCFESYRDRFDRTRLLLQKPQVPNNRAIAIAHRTLTISGDHDLAEQVYRWIDAPGLIYGWNSKQDERNSVRQLSSWGHLLCPSDWAVNLPALSLASDNMPWPKFAMAQSLPAGEKTIPFTGHHNEVSSSDQQVAFILTDGDNLQWALGDFAWNKSFWASPQLERMPFGVGLPIADLMEVAPDAYLFFQKTKPPSTSVLVAPEYVFVDHFGTKLSPRRREQLLTWYAQRSESVLQRSGLNSIVLLGDSLEHPRSLEAWGLLAAGAPSLSAAFLVQYDAYEAGRGKVWHVKRPGGSSVPFISAAYSLWANVDRPRAGGPVEIAALLNTRRDDHEQTSHREPTEVSTPSWIAVHAWSKYRESSTNEEAANGVAGTYSGVDAAAWSAKRLKPGTSLISPEQLSARSLVEGDSPERAKTNRSALKIQEGSPE